MFKPLRTLFLPIFAVTFSLLPASPAVFTWSGAAGDGSLQTAANWTEENFESHYGNDLQFVENAYPTLTWGSGEFAFGRLQVLDTVTTPYTFSGTGLLRIGAGIDNHSSRLVTLSFNQLAAVTLSGEISVANRGEITLSGNSFILPNPRKLVVYGDNSGTYRTLTLAARIAGEDAVDLEVRDKARVVLTGANNQYRATTIYSGLVQVGDGGTTGNLGSGKIDIKPDGYVVFKREGEVVLLNQITATEGKTILFEGPGTVRFQGGSANTGVGAIVQGGTVVVERDTAFDNSALAGSLTINAGARVELGGTGGNQLSDTLVLALDGGTLDLCARAEKVNRLTGTGTITNSALGQSELRCALGDFEGPIASSPGGRLKLAKTGQDATFWYRGTADADFDIYEGILAAQGEIKGSLAISVAGAVSVGGADHIGLLTLGSAPALGGRTIFELQADGSGDKLSLPGLTLKCAGALIVTNLSPLSAGAVFDLVDADSFEGEFTSLELPAPGPGRSWVSDGLYTTGTLILNTHPTAPNIARTCGAGSTLTLFLADIVGACVDPDAGDSVTFVSVTKAPGSDASLTVTDTEVVYVPAAGQTGVEQLGYEVQDTRGAKVAGVILITIGSGGGSRFDAIRIENGKPVLVCAGVPGDDYVIERSPGAGFEAVTEVYSFQAAATPAEWTDPDPPTAAFYRLRRVPSAP